MPVSVIILCIAFIAIALRQVISVIIPIWVIMAFGAVASIALQNTSALHALASIDPDVMLYLFGVFLIAQAMEESGYLAQLTNRLFARAKTGKQALFVIIFALGLSSALLMNDTIAIVGTPIIIQLCKVHKNLTKPLLFALAFAVTIGSTVTPIGNPQNLLIAIQGGLAEPFFAFIKALLIPTLLNLIVAYLFIYVIYRKRMNETIVRCPGTATNHD